MTLFLAIRLHAILVLALSVRDCRREVATPGPTCAGPRRPCSRNVLAGNNAIR